MEQTLFCLSSIDIITIYYYIYDLSRVSINVFIFWKILYLHGNKKKCNVKCTKWMEPNICQSIWDKSEVLWREHVGQHNGNFRKPLAAWNFSSQKSLSPFLAWADTPCKEHLTLLFINNKSKLLLFTIPFYEITHTNTPYNINMLASWIHPGSAPDHLWGTI